MKNRLKIFLAVIAIIIIGFMGYLVFGFIFGKEDREHGVEAEKCLARTLDIENLESIGSVSDVEWYRASQLRGIFAVYRFIADTSAINAIAKRLQMGDSRPVVMIEGEPHLAEPISITQRDVTYRITMIEGKPYEFDIESIPLSYAEYKPGWFESETFNGYVVYYEGDYHVRKWLFYRDQYKYSYLVILVG